MIPVVVLDDAERAVPLARALLTGGLRTIEVTLRTPAALEAIERIAAEVPRSLLGAGTVARAEQVAAAVRPAPASSSPPGTRRALLDALERKRPAVPRRLRDAVGRAGAAGARDRLREAVPGVRRRRRRDGARARRPVPELRLCPTGGIDAARAPDYLALPNVACVGGSWITAGAPDWDAVTARARAAAALRPPR